MKMRIIGGKHRHRLIKYPTTLGTRPSKDVTREAIFSSLGQATLNSEVIDLFAGSGAYGLEALSRGAKWAILADNNELCIETINENIKQLNISNVEVWHLPYHASLDKMKQNQIKVDLVFLDPPYLDKINETVINRLIEDELLNPNAIIVVEHEKMLNINETLFKKVKQYKYGRTKVTILWR